MNLRTLLIPLIVVALALSLVPATRADISSSAVLFLRIAPGARAAGMGEAFVAIADDATATHWNPAGLGAYPLADTWAETDIPARLRPIVDLAAVRTGGGSTFKSYDVWAVTSQGLARFDQKRWHTGDAFNTRTDQTLDQLARTYLGIDNDSLAAAMSALVAAENSPRPKDAVSDFRDSVLAHVPDSYDQAEELTRFLDSLVSAYDLALIDWDRFKRAEELYRDGMKDGELDREETERIFFAVEKSRNRYIPEEITIPYAMNVGGAIRGIVGVDKTLLVASDRGLVTFNGRRWRTIGVTEGLPSTNITALYGTTTEAFIGTDSGIARFTGVGIGTMPGQAPAGTVQAIGGTSANSLWAVIDGDLWHLDGTEWRNGTSYTVALDDTPESIARRFAVYGTQAEIDGYMEKMKEMKQPVALRLSDMMAQNAATAETDTTEADTTRSDTTQADTAAAAQPAAPDVSGETLDMQNLNPGEDIRVPYLHQIKGEVYSIHERGNELFIGTEYGLLRFDNNTWSLPGWKTQTVSEGQTIDSVLSERQVYSAGSDANSYREAFLVVNGLDEGELEAGDEVLVYANPAATPIHEIVTHNTVTYFASEVGLFQLSDGEFSRNNLKGLGRSSMKGVSVVASEPWFNTDRKVVLRASGRPSISTMYVKWLPELADDLYYLFFSGTSPVSGVGTLGGSVTFISYGTIQRTGEAGTELGTFESFDIAFTGSFGTSLTNSLKGGISAKVIYSKLSDQGAGQEQGTGTSTGFAVDLGILYEVNPKLHIGAAVTNLGPKMAYINAEQADDLPRNLSVGFAYKLFESDYYHFLVTGEANKLLVGLDDGISTEVEQTIFNGGGEFSYADIFAVRAGYIYDQEGQVKNLTLGAGLRPADLLRFDFSYIPSNTASALANTLRVSLSLQP